MGKKFIHADSFIFALFALPPTPAKEAKYGQWSKGEIDDAFIQRLSRPFTQLLGSAGANGALGIASGNAGHEKEQQEYEE